MKISPANNCVQATPDCASLLVDAQVSGAPDAERFATNRRSKVTDHQIIDTNAENISSCSLCRYKDPNNLGYRRKTDWLKERYAEGLRHKVLRSRRFGDIGIIEYAPGNHAWRPVEAKGYLVIHCLMVNSEHKGKGLGTLLLPYGMFSVIYDGKLLAGRPVSGTRFWFIMRNTAKSAGGTVAAAHRQR